MISIIVPIYNNEKYLPKCIESIQNQIFQDWELLLVDDGSSDSSGVICDSFAKENHRIKVIHKENGGVSSARNCGLDHASGDYIMFVDSDDWIEPDLCQKLLDGIQEADLAIGGYTVISNAGKVRYGVHENKKVEISSELRRVFNPLCEQNLFNTPWSKLYCRTIIAEQRFDEKIRLGEDLLFNLNYLDKCKNIFVVSTMGYMYNLLNENSATKKLRDDDFSQIVYLYRKERCFEEKNHCRKYSHGILEKQLCLKGINLLQLLFYSNINQSEKMINADKMVSNLEFQYACEGEYAFPLKYTIPQKLCRKKSRIGLMIFFLLKKIVGMLKK